MNDDSWLDNVDKKIKLRWMLSFYIKDVCEQKFNKQLCNFYEFLRSVKLEFEGEYDKLLKIFIELQNKDSIFNILKQHSSFINVASTYEKETNKLLYQTCHLVIDFSKLTNDETDSILGYLYLKGYQNRILAEAK